MLTTTRRTALASASVAALALVAGAVLTIGSTWTAPVTTTDTAPPLGGTVVAAQDGGADCGERNCDVRWNEPPPRPGSPGGSQPDGGQRCYFVGRGSGPVLIGDRDATHPTLVLTQAETVRIEVPCYQEGLGWYLDGCYYGDFPALVTPPEPPPGKTAEDGRWYWERCLISVSGEIPNQSYTFFADLRWRWFDIDEVPVVTPQEVALSWLARVGLDGVMFAISPPATGAGLVGLPVWLGVTATPNTMGPISDTSCIGDVCVSISARVTRVEWDMGDGNVVTCTPEQHEIWQPGLDFRNPGDRCHHIYRQSSRHLPDRQYVITATSTWLVTWSTPAESGTLSPTRTSQTTVRIEEIQVLTSQ